MNSLDSRQLRAAQFLIQLFEPGAVPRGRWNAVTRYEITGFIAVLSIYQYVEKYILKSHPHCGSSARLACCWGPLPCSPNIAYGDHVLGLYYAIAHLERSLTICSHIDPITSPDRYGSISLDIARGERRDNIGPMVREAHSRHADPFILRAISLLDLLSVVLSFRDHFAQ